MPFSQELAGKFFSLPLVEIVEEGGGVRPSQFILGMAMQCLMTMIVMIIMMIPMMILMKS